MMQKWLDGCATLGLRTGLKVEKTQDQTKIKEHEGVLTGNV